jgi:NTE family protein
MGQMAKFVRNRIVLIMSQQKSFLVKREKLEKTIDFLVPAKKFEDLLIPLIVTSTDLTNGEQVIYNSGNLIDAIVQSCSIPGYVQPTERGEQILVDGGVIDPIPVELVKKSTDYVVAVNITKDSMKEFKDKNIFEFLSRAEQIKSKYLAKSKMEKADFVIHPSVGSLHWSRFDEFDTLLTNGRDAANVSLNELKADLKRKNRLFYRWKQKLGLMS